MTDIPSFSRRRVLTGSLGVLGSLAGCSSNEQAESEIPVGSLGFANAHSLPHTLGIHVTGVRARDSGPMETPDNGLSSMLSLRSGEQHLVPSVLTDHVEYELSFTFDGESPSEPVATTTYSPDGPPDTFLSLVVEQSGAFSWEKTSVTTQHRFTSDRS